MNKRLGTLVASVALVAVAEIGSGAPSTEGRVLPSPLPRACIPNAVSNRPCPPPRMPSPQAPRPRR
jgi:hypothetical protein